MTFEIPLTKGRTAIVDDGDYPALVIFKWTLSETRRVAYAVRVGHRPEGGFGRIYMHRQIMAPERGRLVDHCDGDGLNNRRGNLRVCTQTENKRNAPSRRGGSEFKGVSWHRLARKWQVHIVADGHKYYLGLFISEVEAALAYDRKAVEVHGAFAHLNFPNHKAA